MKSGVVSWLGAGLAAMLMVAQVWAFDGRYREIDWNTQLGLSEEQAQQIREIEKKYHNQIRELVPEGSDWKEKKWQGQRNEADKLMSGMGEEMRSVLTAEQLEQAAELMHDQHSKMRIRMARQLALELEMPIEQEHQLLTEVKSMHDNYQWPMDKKQLDEDRNQFEQVLHSVLSEEQLQTLDERRKEAMKRWQSARERGFPDHDGDDDRKRSHGGDHTARLMPPPLLPPE